MQTAVVRRARPAAALLRALGCLAALVLLAAAPLRAQAGQVAGTVTAEGGRPLSGATVQVAGTGRQAVTAPDGRYTITGVPAGARQVRATAIGHAAQTVSVTVSAGGTAAANFSLAVAAVRLDSVVAVGYTTQRARTVSDAVSRVRGSDLRQSKAATVEEALRGRVAGVNVAASGQPGRPASIVVRGQNFLGAADPLYVIDGMYTRSNPNLNPDDIESVDVLKDASAAAQYGAQSANGVIVITTRRGRAGPPKLAVTSYYGFQDVPTRIGFVDSRRWQELNAMARANGGLPADNTPVTANTDWQAAIFRSGAVQDHNLEVSGGNESVSYLIGGGYFDQRGTIIDTGFNRASFRVNSEARRTRWRAGQNLSLSRSVRDNVIGFPLIDAVRLQPAIPVRDPANPGGWGYGSGNGVLSTFGTNPVGAFNTQTSTDYTNRVLGNAFGELNLTGWLKYRLNLGIDYQDTNWRNFVRMVQLRENTVPTFNEGRDRRDDFTSWLAENLLTANLSRGEHSLNAVAGVTEQHSEFRRLEAYRRGFTDEDLTEIDAGSSNFQNTGRSTPASLRGYLVRANYSFADRYLLTGSYRRDGSSKFGPNNKWADFASASAGWVVSEEPFFGNTPLARAFDYMKLRGSYGTLGNQDIGDFRYSAQIVGNQSYLFGGSIATGATQLALANPDIRWQSQKQGDVGLDLALFGNRVNFTADWYRSSSSGLLVDAPIPWSLTGPAASPTINAGTVRNTGFELSADYTVRRPGLQVRWGANLTTISNKVVALGNGGQPVFAGFSNVSRTAVGGSIGEFFVIKTLGIFQSDAEAQAYRSTHGTVIQPNARAGDIKYADLNDDGVINDDDRYVAGSPIPSLQGGFSMDATWRRFNLGLALRGQRGNKIFNVARYWTDRMDENSNYRQDLSPWTTTNTNTDDPRAVFGAAGADNARANTDRWLEDGSFLRIQNVQLGYQIPDRVLSRIGVNGQGTRVYLNFQNLYTFTGFSNWDPEVVAGGNTLSRGIDDGEIYPNPRTVTFGVEFRP
jgi:TonB-linked SusC/RagA family outer membrane protein